MKKLLYSECIFLMPTREIAAIPRQPHEHGGHQRPPCCGLSRSQIQVTSSALLMRDTVSFTTIHTHRVTFTTHTERLPRAHFVHIYDIYAQRNRFRSCPLEDGSDWTGKETEKAPENGNGKMTMTINTIFKSFASFH